jgi:hypothetical protein
MRGSAAAANGAAAAMEETQLDAGLAGDDVQIAMGAEDLPGAGQHAAVFVGVGVAQHDFLPVVPGGHQLAIVGAAHSSRQTAGPCAGLQWIRRAAPASGRDRGPSPRPDAAEARETDDGENVVHARGAADDVLANRFRRAAVLDLGDHAEGFKHAGRLQTAVGNDSAMVSAMASCSAVACRRVLADIERVQVQAEGADLQNQRIDKSARDAQAALAASEARSVSRSSMSSSTSNRPAAPGQMLLSLGERVGRYGERCGGGPGCSIVRRTRALTQMMKRR